MIISASRRTDIPAFYTEWFLERLSAGSVTARNPVNQKQQKTISLAPGDVTCFVFWTKDASFMQSWLKALAPFRYYFQYTITPYGKDIEPEVPQVEARCADFIALSSRIGKERLVWRYDPVLLSPRYPIAYHVLAFSALAGTLAPACAECVISFVDEYPRNRYRMKAAGCRAPDENERRTLASAFSSLAEKHGLLLRSCAEPYDLTPYGIEHGSCIDAERIRLLGGRVDTVAKDKNQRAECGCLPSIDIGAYHTCTHGCVYCYATGKADLARKNYSRHIPANTSLMQ